MFMYFVRGFCFEHIVKWINFIVIAVKKQPHKMTHVEIWLGDGPKTIGSRWHKGHVQVFDSYAFEAKSYHSPTYHFKSIDTWLMGICRRFVLSYAEK